MGESANPTNGSNGSGADREQIHLPAPSLIPFATASGITVTLLGLIMSWWIVAFGVLVTAIAVVRWIRTTRAEIAELPSEN